MKINELLEKTGWKLLTTVATSNEVKGVYCGDLLSWVMGNGLEKQAWITVQTHMNIIAVAKLREFSCIVLVKDCIVEESVIQKANEEGMVIIQSPLPAYETACVLYDLKC